MVTAAMFINYVDRGNLATAAPLMQSDLGISPEQLGILLSAFYYGYVPLMPATGWLAERYGAKAVLATGVTVWSIATMLTGFAHGFGMLLALRILLGVGESVSFPCAAKLIANAVPVSRLGVANGIMAFGYLLGPAIGTFIGGHLMAHFGWRPVFVLFGLASVLWVIPWLRTRVAPAGEGAPPAAAVAVHGAAPAPSSETEGPAPTFAEILSQRSLWGTCIGHFSSNYCYYFILAWLPFYMVKSRGYSMETMSDIVSWAYALNAAGALGMGWFADRWIRSGRSATFIHKAPMALAHLGGIVCMGGVVMLGQTGSIASLFVFELISGMSFPGIFAIAQILAGNQATGRWVGVQNAVGNTAGLVAPAITGFLVGQKGGFELAFAISAAVSFLGFIGWVLVLPKIAPLRWSTATAAPQPAAA
jgi:MFS family permease